MNCGCEPQDLPLARPAEWKIMKRLQPARVFNEKIIANRREFIASEIAALEVAVMDRDAQPVTL